LPATRRFDGGARASYVIGMRHLPFPIAAAAALALAGLLTAAHAQDTAAPSEGTPDELQQLEPLDPAPAPELGTPGSGDDPQQAEGAPGRDGDAPPGVGVPLDRDAMLAELYAHLAKAQSAEEAAPIAKTIESLWLQSGSDTIGLLMQRAIKAVADQKPELAMQLLDTVVELAPDYAEGWSRRAVLYYLQNDVEHAVGDLRRVLALDPNHYMALEALARILRESGQKKSALSAYQELLRIYPHLPGAKEAADELKLEVEGQGI
jgi:tetratricopeptide (TPR) repeat protein